MKFKINLNIYDSNLHFVLLFALALMAIIMLLTIKVEPTKTPVRYNADTGSFREILGTFLAIILSII